MASTIRPMGAADIPAAFSVAKAAIHVTAAADYSAWQCERWLEDYSPRPLATALTAAATSPTAIALLVLVVEPGQPTGDGRAGDSGGGGDGEDGKSGRGGGAHGGNVIGGGRGDGGVVAGVVQVALRSPTTATILGLFVHPAHGRRGYGSRLLTAAEGLAAAWGASRVRLRASTTALALYRKRGYVVDAETRPGPPELGAEVPLQRRL